MDLTAAREAGWQLPVERLDVWPEGREAWRTLWQLPEGLGLLVSGAGKGECAVALACGEESGADKVQAALSRIVPAGSQALDRQVAALGDKLQSGQITGDAATRYESLLKEAKSVLAAARWEVVEQVVWIHLRWQSELAAVAGKTIDSFDAMRTGWLDAAAFADQSNHRRVIAALGGYLKATGQYPPGVAESGSLLPPDTRLSWIATMLPYFEHRDWHGALQWGYSWNSAQNRGVTRRPLDALVNPALSARVTDTGYPVTHYVGVAGVGEDAARLPPSDPRAGLFGYARSAHREEIADGASNTLALLGVSARLGPWAAGGDATVRALVKRPYVNGPDGFGSGQPQGMFASMADGSVRFLSKDVDPAVLEQLATIRGRRK